VGLIGNGYVEGYQLIHSFMHSDDVNVFYLLNKYMNIMLLLLISFIIFFKDGEKNTNSIKERKNFNKNKLI